MINLFIPVSLLLHPLMLHCNLPNLALIYHWHVHVFSSPPTPSLTLARSWGRERLLPKILPVTRPFLSEI